MEHWDSVKDWLSITYSLPIKSVMLLMFAFKNGEMGFFTQCFEAEVKYFNTKLATQTCTICREVWYVPHKFHLYLIIIITFVWPEGICSEEMTYIIQDTCLSTYMI